MILPRGLFCAALACLSLATSAAPAQVQSPTAEELRQALAGLQTSALGVAVSATPSRKRSAPAELPFTRQQASEIGIDVMDLLEPIDFLPPIWNGRGLAAGDVDRDGYLDILVATKHGVRLFMDEGKFRVTALSDALVGDTHSILLSDFNHDGHLDLIVGNDFRPPDYFYRGDGRGGFEFIKRSEGIIPVSTNTTMSVDTADYNNDLRLDILLTQIAAAATGPSVRLRLRPLKEYCQDLKRIADRFGCELALQQKMLFRFFSKMQPSDILRCRTIPDPRQQQQCAAMMLWLVVHREEDPALCERMPESQKRAQFYCHALFTPAKRGSEEQYAESIAVVKNENTLLRATGDGRFEEVTDAFGWQNYMFQSAFVMIDVDNDGDLDLVANSISGPIWFYKNNDSANNAIYFEMRDEIVNRNCIGCKLRIYYGPKEGRAQLREIQSGGGYLSFDAAFAHFGLGPATSVSRLEIDWSTGGTTKIQGPFPANARYTIRREASPTSPAVGTSKPSRPLQ